LIALSKFHVTSQLLKSLISVLIAGINDPSVSLHQNGWAKVVLGMPPVRGAGGLAACAKDALIESIEQLSVFDGLVIFSLALNFIMLTLEEGINRFILSVEVRHVNHKILKHKHKHQRRYR